MAQAPGFPRGSRLLPLNYSVLSTLIFSRSFQYVIMHVPTSPCARDVYRFSGAHWVIPWLPKTSIPILSFSWEFLHHLLPRSHDIYVYLRMYIRLCMYWGLVNHTCSKFVEFSMPLENVNFVKGHQKTNSAENAVRSHSSTDPRLRNRAHDEATVRPAPT